MNVFIQRPRVMAGAVLCITLMLFLPVGTAQSQTASPTAVLRDSVASMKASLHEVHIRGTEMGEGTSLRRLRLHYSGDCITKPNSTRSRWHLQGAQLVGRVLTPFDRYYVANGSDFGHPSEVWERDTAQGNTWRRVIGSTALPDILFICPVPDFVAGQAPTAPNAHLMNLGLARAAGVATWHLRSVVTLGTGTGVTVRQTDLYINAITHFLVRLGNEVRMQGATSSISTAKLSKFNSPVTIQVPH